jgi:nucleoside-diphosphate-sugar epimerase
MKDCIIVTGSSGLIGGALIERIYDRFVEFGFDRKGPPHPPRETEHVIDCDLASSQSVERALSETRRLGGSRIASVVHLAAYYDFSGRPSPLYEKVTVRGTERLLRGLRDFSVEQFVFGSTMLVHAPCKPGQQVDEDWPLQPKWDYPKSKVATEQVIREQRRNIPAVLLRIAGVYDDYGHSIPLAQQLTRIYERKLISHFFPGDPLHGQAYVHLDDLVDAIVRVIDRRRQLPPETTLILAEPRTLSYAELQREMGRLVHGKEWTTWRIPKTLAKFGARMLDKFSAGDEEQFIKPWMIDMADDHYEFDISRARTLIDWEPKRSLRDSLPKIVAALKADPVAWYERHELRKPAHAAQPVRRKEAA